MTRLEVISSYISEEEKVIDVGCDQALLSKLLAKRGIYSIASDLRRNIIENALINTPLDLQKFITFRIGDGITLNQTEKDYTIVIAGMGAYTILDIVKKEKVLHNKIITVSNNNHEVLRKEMLKLGYKVLEEEIIKENNKYYNLIVFVPGLANYTLEDSVIGINHKNKKLLKEKNEYLISKYKKILTSVNNEELENIVKILENYTY